MLDPVILRRKCAECGSLDYDTCRKTCKTYKTLNTPCELCTKIGGVYPFAISTAKGPRKILACLQCLEKLT